MTTTLPPRLLAQAVLSRYLDDASQILENIVDTYGPHLEEYELKALEDHVKSAERLNRTLGAGVE